MQAGHLKAAAPHPPPRKMLSHRLCLAALFALSTLRAAEPLPDLPDAKGRAGMMAAVVLQADGSEAILAAGGANFPDGPPWEGGTKVFHRDIFLLQRHPDGKWAWHKVGNLPAPAAYAAFCPSPDQRSLLVAGGADARRHLDTVWRIHPDGRCERLAPPLPQPRAYAGFAVVQGRLVLLGGSSGPDAAPAIGNTATLSLSQPEEGWQVATGSQEHARILTLAGSDGHTVLWGGGCTLAPEAGRPARTYRRDVFYGIDLPDEPASRDLGTPLAAAAGPGVPVRDGLLFVGGDHGAHSGKPLAEHPGQSCDILLIDSKTRKATVVGRWPTPLATAPLLRLGDDLVTISGETRPGVRTPACSTWTIPPALR